MTQKKVPGRKRTAANVKILAQQQAVNVGCKADKTKLRKMGLDLTLISISNEAKFIIEKAKKNIYYAIDLDKIYDTDNLKLHLKMLQSKPDGTPESVLEELIHDSEQVVKLYPHDKKEDYRFYSKTRGYETINYLLKCYLTEKLNEKYDENSKIFYEGFDIDCGKLHIRFQYLENSRTKEISELLNQIDFIQLEEYYDYEKLVNVVYKLTRPENFNYLKIEFDELKLFFQNAKNFDSFVLIKIA